jgi:hypothetical protein
MLIYMAISSHVCGLADWRFHPEKLQVLVATQTGELEHYHAKANVLQFSD